MGLTLPFSDTGSYSYCTHREPRSSQPKQFTDTSTLVPYKLVLSLLLSSTWHNIIVTTVAISGVSIVLYRYRTYNVMTLYR